ncbi:hypothetical protein BU25DRAFT_495895 [Macroventuria anomochaeta]|uniref:Uncharacterized protein n=1 Tax=Macroventuria anomochaeta TaxID=301207 RepID=A0ACB6RJF3_9PLEO|nr:uncharacterized protein BU25DRAFT_495895 [Macroventuria anomochaeta]KAF2621233.1 hypothetical protein BU25DRAFT_495895 [Macroventuria anomochaeta]
MAEKNNFKVAPVAGTFVTRDIDRHGPIVKMYMFPGLRAQELGISKAEVVYSAIKSLPEERYQSLKFEPLQAYLREAAAKWSMEIHIFSFDLISPQKSRIKIYTRAPNTSIEYPMDALTLGGRHDLSMYSAEVIQDVQDFWMIFIGDAPDVLPQSGAERGPGFYFTAKAEQPITPKVYISLAPFCENDLEVLKRLRRYFVTRRDAARMLLQMEIYEKALKSIYGTDYLEKTSDIHMLRESSKVSLIYADSSWVLPQIAEIMAEQTGCTSPQELLKMHSFGMSFVYFASLLGATFALPTARGPPAPRSCQISYPTQMIEFTPLENPSTSLTDFCVTSDTRVKYVEFGSIPATARGACQLEFVFPAGYSVAGAGTHQVNVWKTERPASLNDTWENAPKTVTTFGTVTLNSKPDQEARIIVNSGSCDSMRNFKIGLADTRIDSSVTYTQQFPPAEVVAGMRIVHSC